MDHPPSQNKLNRKVWKVIYKTIWAKELKRIDNLPGNQLDTETILLYDRIHQNITNLRLKEAQKIRKLKMGTIPWSKEWSKAQKTLEAWILLLNWREKGSKKLKHNRVRIAVKQANLTGAFDKDIPDIIKEIQSARTRKRIKMSRAAFLREQEQQQILEEESGNNLNRKNNKQEKKENTQIKY